MRVTEETPDRLTAKIRATFTGVFCAVFGGFFALIGAAALAGGQAQGALLLAPGLAMAALGAFLLFRPTQLHLDRHANTATITRHGLRGQSQQVLPLDTVDRLHVHKKGSGSGKLYHLVVWVPEGPHKGEYPLTRVFHRRLAQGAAGAQGQRLAGPPGRYARHLTLRPTRLIPAPTPGSVMPSGPLGFARDRLPPARCARGSVCALSGRVLHEAARETDREA